MSSDEFGDERRKLTPRPEEERIVDSVVYYGLGQVLLCCVPVIWLIFQSPIQRVDLVTGAVVTLLCTVSTIGARRARLVDVGPPWPRIDEVTLGIGDGYDRLLTRATVLSSTLALGAFGAATVGIATSLAWLVVAWAAAVGVGATLAYPVLARRTARAAGTRLAYHAVALGTIGAVGAPLDTGVGFGTAAVVYPLLWTVAVLDGREALLAAVGAR